MGNQSAKGQTLTDSDIQLLSRLTQIPPHILQQLYEAFRERAGRDGRMTIAEFKNAYPEMNPGANMFDLNNDAERVFMMFDKDHNGVLTFDEFLMAYILLQRGGVNPVNRWQNVINTIPPGFISRPNYVNAAETLQLLQYMNNFYKIPNFNPAVQQNLIWSQLTPQMDPNGYVPLGDFLQILAAQPQIQQHIW